MRSVFLHLVALNDLQSLPTPSSCHTRRSTPALGSNFLYTMPKELQHTNCDTAQPQPCGTVFWSSDASTGSLSGSPQYVAWSGDSGTFADVSSSLEDVKKILLCAETNAQSGKRFSDVITWAMPLHWVVCRDASATTFDHSTLERLK